MATAVLVTRGLAEAVRTLKQLHAELLAVVRTFPEERLDQPPVPEPPHTAYTQFIGTTQHGLYHAGQIALLKRALGSGQPPGLQLTSPRLP